METRTEKEKKDQLSRKVEKMAEAQKQRLPAHGAIYSGMAGGPRVDRRKHKQRKRKKTRPREIYPGWVARGGVESQLGPNCSGDPCTTETRLPLLMSCCRCPSSRPRPAENAAASPSVAPCVGRYFSQYRRLGPGTCRVQAACARSSASCSGMSSKRLPHIPASA